jgi:putative MATE family efflux protein
MGSPRSLTEGSIARRLLTFALPILLGNVVQSLDGSVNSVWIGHFLGEAALTASSSANTVLFLLISALYGASTAGSILVGQYLGAERLYDAKRVVGTSTSFSVLVAIAMGALGWVICRPLLVAMSTPAQALPLAVAYLRILFIALPFAVLYASATSVLRGAGDSKTPLYFLILNMVLDITLNPLLIFGLGPVPELGIQGSALAGLLAQAISAVLLIIYLYRRKDPLCLRGSELGLLRVDWSIVATLVTKGVPLALQMTVLSLSMVLMVALANQFGIDTTAAFGAAFQVWIYVQIPTFAICMAVSSMAAQNIGARKWDRVSSTALIGVLYQLALSIGLVLLVEALGTRALGLFLPQASSALQIALHLNRIGSWSFVFFGTSLVLFGVVRANGAVIVPLLILTLTMVGVRFFLALILLDSLKADAIWWSLVLSSLISAILAVLYYKRGRWREGLVLEPQRVERCLRSCN